MARKSSILVSGASTIIHSLVIPFFLLIFTIYYKPYGIYELLQMENANFSFNVTIIFCIVLVSVSITRGWLYLIGKYRDISRTQYFVWCMVEMVVASLFASLYIVLVSKSQLQFFDIAGTAVITLVATSAFPCSILWLGFELYSRDMEEARPVDDRSLIRFHDEYNKLKLVISSKAVIFIKSEDNYVQINYMDQGKPRKFILRSSMRALEETLSRHGLVRCHRSYYINPLFIKIVHRDGSNMIVAELSQDGFESIPISRKYHDEITRLL
jgi:hypothetical protein